MERAIKRLSIAATAGMFLVLIMGATVTNTGSGEGCGRSWPLCEGKLLPAIARAPLIEYSHRAVTGVEGFLIMAVAAGAWLYRRRYPGVKWMALVMVVSLFLQAGMGAWAVHSPQATGVLALHFGISLVAFASVFLTMRILHGASLRDERAVPMGFRRAAWGALVAAYVVAYLGAYVRHANADLACSTWPLCNGEVIPPLSGAVGAAFAHRVAALASVAIVAVLVVWAHTFRAARPDLYRASLAALTAVVAQALIGGFVILSRLTVISTLAHAGMMAILFVCLCEACRGGLPWARPVPAAQRVSSGTSVLAR